MGSIEPLEESKFGGWLGKTDASLDEKLKSVKWGEFRLGDLFEFKGIKQSKSQRDIPIDNDGIPYVIQSTNNNMCGRYVNKQYLIDTNEPPIKGNVIVLGVTLPAVSYQPIEFGASQVIEARADFLNEKNGLFFVISISKQMNRFSYQNKPGIEIYKNLKIQLPITQSNEIDFDFMESFISELEEERLNKLKSYLEVTGLKNYELTEDEKRILKESEKWKWEEYNLENLFGKSTRGKRLKGEDRFIGNLPFVTAGEANEGISAFISNDVEIFSKNTTTIDMFGSAKYRNYNYGADDHVAVVHTEKLPKHSAIFVTSAIHKSSHTGKFDYSNNFYASDADELNIQLPTKNSTPDYKSMETFIRAIEKLVIKDVVLYAEKKLGTMKEVAYSQSSTPTLAAEASNYKPNCGDTN